MRRQYSEFNEINFMSPKASRYKPAESPVWGQKLWFYNLLATSFPQKLQLFPAVANPCTTKIKTWGDRRKSITDGHFDSCPHLMEQSTAALIPWQFQLRHFMLLQHRWESTFPLLVGTQSVCAERNLGWESSCQTVARKEATQKQKPQKENSAGALVFSSAFSIPHVVCP